MLDRLVNDHESVIERVRTAITKTEEGEDWGTNDLLMGDVLRRHALQVWFVSSRLADVPIVAPACATTRGFARAGPLRSRSRVQSAHNC